MKDHYEPGRMGRSRRRLKSEIEVVDLSKRSSALTPLHDRILDALRRTMAGILSKEELLRETEGYSLSDVERALRDLSLRGLVKVLWRTPFRFLAFATESGMRHDAAAITLPAGLPG